MEVPVNETQPGSEIDIQIITMQNSFVGLLAVDQSVLLQHASTHLSESDVFGTLVEYGNANARPAFGEYCPVQNTTLTKTTFEKSGLFVLSNLDQLIPSEFLNIGSIINSYSLYIFHFRTNAAYCEFTKASKRICSCGFFPGC